MLENIFKTNSLKVRILWPLAIVFSLITAIVLSATVYHINKGFDESVSVHTREIQNFYNNALDNRKVKLATGLKVVLYKKDIISSFRNKNRDELYKLTKTLFAELQSELSVTHLYFHNKDQRNFLRVHQSDRYGDLINRRSLQDAQKHQRLSSGVELGPLGTYSLRVVEPIIIDNKIIGYIELSQKIDDIIKQVKLLFDVDSIMLVGKAGMNKDDWSKGALSSDKRWSWDYLANHLIVTSTLKKIPDEVKNLIVNEAIHEGRFEIDVGDATYLVWDINIDEFGHNTIDKHFEYLTILDISSQVSDNRTSLALMVSSTGLLFSLLFVFFYKITDSTDLVLQRYQRRVKQQQQSLQKSVDEKSINLEMAESIAHLGSWNLNFNTNKLSWSDETYNIFGINPDKEIDLDDFVGGIHPEDKDSVLSAWSAALTGEPYEIDHRIVANGKTKWVHEKAIVKFDRDMKPLVAFGAVYDITVRKEVEDKLRNALIDAEHARDAAEVATHAKSAFLANMSHELRTPMHGILSFAELGLKKSDKNSDKKMHKYFNNIEKSGLRLLKLLNNLLDISKLESGRMEFVFDNGELINIIEQVLTDLDAVLRKKSIYVDINKFCKSQVIYFDSDKILQVLHNLLSNAIKFSPEGSVISISCETALLESSDGKDTIEAVAITVSDEGVGIPEDEIDLVFNKFIQSHATKNISGGTGLGLAICKEIVSGHGGTITIQNNSSKGVSVTVTLPVG